MDLQLKDKVALVTAASSGLGYATAVQLLNEGAKVVVCGRSLPRLQQAYIGAKAAENLTLLQADLLSKTSIADLMHQVILSCGKLDILITNMSGPPLTDFEHATDEQWHAATDGILMSCVDVIKAALPHLRQSTAASILTITSFTAKQYLPGFLFSNVLRPAVVGLTKSLSKELGKSNIRVNSILPGYTLTERLKEVVENNATKQGNSFQQEVENLSKNIALGRLAEPEEFAKVATFLVSSAASYVTGAMLQVDGGFCEGLY